jgi:hypothetical protein
MKLSRITAAAFTAFVLAGLLASAKAQPTARPTTTAGHIQALFGLFTDNPFTGGQVAPRQYRWVNDNVLTSSSTGRGSPRPGHCGTSACP